MSNTQTCVGQRPGSVYEDDVRGQQHYDDPVGQRDQPAVPLRPPVSEGTAEHQVETEPANQAADHLQNRHGAQLDTHMCLGSSVTA